MNILVPGIYPRSEELVSATRNYDRDRITYEEMLEARTEDIKNLHKLQSGFAYKSTGQMNWQDLLRPVAEITTNSEVRGLKRFFQTNTFWRTVEFNGEVRVIEDELEEWIKKYIYGEGVYDNNEDLFLTLPFIYLFKRHISGIGQNDIADLMVDIIKKLSTLEGLNLSFYEPTFGWRTIDREERELAVEFLERIKENHKGLIFLNTSFFPVSDELDFLGKLPVDGIGIDFYANSLNEVMDVFPVNKYILAGIVDVRSTLIENEEDIINFKTELEKKIPQDKIFFSPSGPPELLPRRVMDEKVENLKEVLI